jgi:hypothetical protein
MNCLFVAKNEKLTEILHNCFLPNCYYVIM